MAGNDLYKYNPGLPMEYNIRLLSAEVDSIREASGTGGGGVSGNEWVAPLPSGGDDTTVLQSLFDTASADAVANKKIVSIIFPGDMVYQVGGLFLRSNLDINFNNSRLVKTANNSGNIFTSNTTSILRTGPWAKNGNTWYGNADNISIRNGVLDCNNKDNLAVLDLHGVRNFFADGMTLITSQWSRNWATRGGGYGRMINGRILGQAGLYQDGLHWQYGGMIFDNWDVESGDDGVAAGDDAVTANVYMDDVHLEYFVAKNIRVKSVRGAAAKVYTAATKPFSGPPNNYSNTGKVRGVNIEVSGQSGLLRNGGIAVFSHKPPNERTPKDLSGIRIHANLRIGNDGKSVWDAVSGVLIGSPTSVSNANPCVVNFPNHQLPAGKVVHLIPDPGGMHAMNGFYQVMATNLSTDSFQLSDIAYRNNIALDGTALSAWTTGKLISIGSGTGYAVGNELVLGGGTYTRPAKYLVTQVSASGAVEAVRRLDEGLYSVLPTTPNTPTGGSGSGCTLHLFLEHDGVNAYGVKSYAGSDVSVSGQIHITDTVNPNATRFRTLQLVDTEYTDIRCSFPSVPANGGQVINESTYQLSKKHTLSCHMVCNGPLNNNMAPIMLSNSADTVVSGSIENLPSNTAAVVFPIGSNVLHPRPIVVIAGATNAVFQVAHGGWKAGQIVRIYNNVLSTGSLDGYYAIRRVYGDSSFALRTLDGQQVGLGSATVVTLGSIEVANNTVKFTDFVITPEQNSDGHLGIDSLSTAPHRVSSVTISDCSFQGIATPVAANVKLAPCGYVERDSKL